MRVSNHIVRLIACNLPDSLYFDTTPKSSPKASKTIGIRDFVDEINIAIQTDVLVIRVGLRGRHVDYVSMIVCICDDSELKNPCIGNDLFDVGDLGRIHIGNRDFDLVVADWANQDFLGTRWVETNRKRNLEISCNDLLALSLDRSGSIDLVNEIRSPDNFWPVLESAGCQDERCRKGCKNDPVKRNIVRRHLQLLRRETAENERKQHCTSHNSQAFESL